MNWLIKLCGGYTKDEYKAGELELKEVKEFLGERYKELSDELIERDKKIAQLNNDSNILREEYQNVLKSNSKIKKEKSDMIEKTKTYAEKCRKIMEANKKEIDKLKGIKVESDNFDNLDEYIDMFNPIFENDTDGKL